MKITLFPSDFRVKHTTFFQPVPFFNVFFKKRTGAACCRQVSGSFSHTPSSASLLFSFSPSSGPHCPRRFGHLRLYTTRLSLSSSSGISSPDSAAWPTALTLSRITSSVGSFTSHSVSSVPSIIFSRYSTASRPFFVTS